MQTQRLGQRQLFNMLTGNLEKRIINLYSEKKDASTVIEYVITVLVRDSLSAAGFSLICWELIREIFLSGEPSGALRRFSAFFEGYFDAAEWKTVVARLYKNEKDYLAATEEARLYRGYLKEKDPTRTDELANHQFILKSVFMGANGRKHTWTLKNAHPTKSDEELAGALKILPLLSIFETNGVRKFTEFVEFTRHATVADLHYAEGQEEEDAGEEGSVNSGTETEQAAQGKVIQNTNRKQKASDALPNEDRSAGDPNNVQSSSGAAPKKTTNKTDPPTTATQSDKNQRASNQKPPKSAKGNQKSKEGYLEKTREQIEEGRNERKVSQKIAKFLKKRGKK